MLAAICPDDFRLVTIHIYIFDASRIYFHILFYYFIIFRLLLLLYLLFLRIVCINVRWGSAAIRNRKQPSLHSAGTNNALIAI